MLRQDNADIRLTPLGHKIGLIDDDRYNGFLAKQEAINGEIIRLKDTSVGANRRVQEFLENIGSTPLKTAATLAELIKRPELSYNKIAPIDVDRVDNLDSTIIEQIDINLKYEGYIIRQQQQVDHFKKLENRRIPDDLDYDDVYNLRKEARQKLKQVKPLSMGQASRISGVSPADISVLLVYLESKKSK